VLARIGKFSYPDFGDGRKADGVCGESVCNAGWKEEHVQEGGRLGEKSLSFIEGSRERSRGKSCQEKRPLCKGELKCPSWIGRFVYTGVRKRE